MSLNFKLKAPVLNEKDVIRACMDLLKLKGYFVVRIQSGLFKTWDGKRTVQGAPQGAPDYACLHPRYRGFLLETKRPGGKLRPAQVYFHNIIRQGFQIPIAVVDSAEALGQWLREHEGGR